MFLRATIGVGIGNSLQHGCECLRCCDALLLFPGWLNWQCGFSESVSLYDVRSPMRPGRRDVNQRERGQAEGRPMVAGNAAPWAVLSRSLLRAQKSHTDLISGYRQSRHRFTPTICSLVVL